MQEIERVVASIQSKKIFLLYTSLPLSEREMLSDTISWYPCLTLEDILSHPELKQKWDWNRVSRFSSLTVENILSHPELKQKWNWNEVSRNKNITLKEIFSHPEIEWNWREVSHSPSLTISDILSHPEVKWYSVSQSPSITLEDIFSHPEVKWNWKEVTRNENITLDDILSHPGLEWDWKWIFTNSFKKERDTLFNEIVCGELKALNSILSFLREEGNFFFASLLLREVVRLHTILLLRKIGMGEEIKDLL